MSSHARPGDAVLVNGDLIASETLLADGDTIHIGDYDLRFETLKEERLVVASAVGGIRTADEVHSILGSGDADMVGIGRPFYAEPDLAARILADDPTPRVCQNSNRCVPAQMLGMKGVCYNPEARRARASRQAS